MGILADVCAGKQKRTITDWATAYAGLTRFITNSNSGNYVNDQIGILPEYEKLITISLETIDTKSIPLENLIRFREKEYNTGGSHYTNLRHNYLSKIDEYVKRLTTEALHEGDEQEILRQFKNEMIDSLESLADALEMKKHDILFSKEMLVAITSIGTAFIEPVTSGIIGIGTATRMAFNYVDGVKKVQKENATAWLQLVAK
jgi:glutathionyl-hydroquinone reductase